jgi:hypothetical protein
MEISEVITELKFASLSEDDYPDSLRLACWRAAEELNSQRDLIVKIAKHEKQLRDELDDLRGIVR